MLLAMRVVSDCLRITVAILAALALVIAAPIHASHHHASGPGQTDGPCVICKTLTAGCTWVAPASLSPLLQQAGVLTVAAPVIALFAPAIVLVPRAPPVHLG
jgi:hypothetical protein